MKVILYVFVILKAIRLLLAQDNKIIPAKFPIWSSSPSVKSLGNKINLAFNLPSKVQINLKDCIILDSKDSELSLGGSISAAKLYKVDAAGKKTPIGETKFSSTAEQVRLTYLSSSSLAMLPIGNYLVELTATGTFSTINSNIRMWIATSIDPWAQIKAQIDNFSGLALYDTLDDDVISFTDVETCTSAVYPSESFSLCFDMLASPKDGRVIFQDLAFLFSFSTDNIQVPLNPNVVAKPFSASGIPIEDTLANEILIAKSLSYENSDRNSIYFTDLGEDLIQDRKFRLQIGSFTSIYPGSTSVTLTVLWRNTNSIISSFTKSNAFSTNSYVLSAKLKHPNNYPNIYSNLTWPMEMTFTSNRDLNDKWIKITHTNYMESMYMFPMSATCDFNDTSISNELGSRTICRGISQDDITDPTSSASDGGYLLFHVDSLKRLTSFSVTFFSHVLRCGKYEDNGFSTAVEFYDSNRSKNKPTFKIEVLNDLSSSPKILGSQKNVDVGFTCYQVNNNTQDSYYHIGPDADSSYYQGPQIDGVTNADHVKDIIILNEHSNFNLDSRSSLSNYAMDISIADGLGLNPGLDEVKTDDIFSIITYLNVKSDKQNQQPYRTYAGPWRLHNSTSESIDGEQLNGTMSFRLPADYFEKSTANACKFIWGSYEKDSESRFQKEEVDQVNFKNYFTTFSTNEGGLLKANIKGAYFLLDVFQKVTIIDGDVSTVTLQDTTAMGDAMINFASDCYKFRSQLPNFRKLFSYFEVLSEFENESNIPVRINRWFQMHIQGGLLFFEDSDETSIHVDSDEEYFFHHVADQEGICLIEVKKNLLNEETDYNTLVLNLWNVELLEVDILNWEYPAGPLNTDVHAYGINSNLYFPTMSPADYYKLYYLQDFLDQGAETSAGLVQNEQYYLSSNIYAFGSILIVKSPDNKIVTSTENSNDGENLIFPCKCPQSIQMESANHNPYVVISGSLHNMSSMEETKIKYFFSTSWGGQDKNTRFSQVMIYKSEFDPIEVDLRFENYKSSTKFVEVATPAGDSSPIEENFSGFSLFFTDEFDFQSLSPTLDTSNPWAGTDDTNVNVVKFNIPFYFDEVKYTHGFAITKMDGGNFPVKHDPADDPPEFLKVNGVPPSILTKVSKLANRAIFFGYTYNGEDRYLLTSHTGEINVDIDTNSEQSLNVPPISIASDTFLDDSTVCVDIELDVDYGISQLIFQSSSIDKHSLGIAQGVTANEECIHTSVNTELKCPIIINESENPEKRTVRLCNLKWKTNQITISEIHMLDRMGNTIYKYTKGWSIDNDSTTDSVVAEVSSLTFKGITQDAAYSSMTLNVPVQFDIFRDMKLEINGDFSLFVIDDNVQLHCRVSLNSDGSQNSYDEFFDICEPNFSNSGYVTITTKTMMKSASTNLPGSSIYITIWPIKVAKTIDDYQVDVYFASSNTPLSMGSEQQGITPHSFTETSPLTKINSLCDLEISPTLIGMPTVVTILVDASSLATELSAFTTVDEEELMPGEVSLYIPFEIFGAVGNSILCYYETTLLNCEASNNVLHIKAPEILSSNSYKVPIKLYGLTTPVLPANYDIVRHACTINNYNPANNRRIQMVVGTGSLVSTTDLAAFFYGAQINSYNMAILPQETPVSTYSPGQVSSLKLRLLVDCLTGLACTNYIVDLTQIKLYIALPMEYFHSSLFTEVPTVQIKEFVANSEDAKLVEESDTDFSSSTVEVMSNLIVCTLPATLSLSFDQNFRYLEVTIGNLVNPINVGMTGFIEAALVNADASTVIRAFKSLNTQSYKPSDPTMGLFMFNKGLNIQFSDNKYRVDITQTGSSTVTINPGRYYPFKLKVNRDGPELNSYIENTITVNHPVIKTYPVSFVVDFLGKKELDGLIASPCNYMPGMYYLFFDTSNDVNYYRMLPTVLIVNKMMNNGVSNRGTIKIMKNRSAAYSNSEGLLMSKGGSIRFWYCLSEPNYDAIQITYAKPPVDENTQDLTVQMSNNLPTSADISPMYTTCNQFSSFHLENVNIVVDQVYNVMNTNACYKPSSDQVKFKPTFDQVVINPSYDISTSLTMHTGNQTTVSYDDKPIAKNAILIRFNTNSQIRVPVPSNFYCSLYCEDENIPPKNLIINDEQPKDTYLVKYFNYYIEDETLPVEMYFAPLVRALNYNLTCFLTSTEANFESRSMVNASVSMIQGGIISPVDTLEPSCIEIPLLSPLTAELNIQLRESLQELFGENFQQRGCIGVYDQELFADPEFDEVEDIECKPTTQEIISQSQQANDTGLRFLQGSANDTNTTTAPTGSVANYQAYMCMVPSEVCPTDYVETDQRRNLFQVSLARIQEHIKKRVNPIYLSQIDISRLSFLTRNYTLSNEDLIIVNSDFDYDNSTRTLSVGLSADRNVKCGWSVNQIPMNTNVTSSAILGCEANPIICSNVTLNTRESKISMTANYLPSPGSYNVWITCWLDIPMKTNATAPTVIGSFTIDKASTPVTCVFNCNNGSIWDDLLPGFYLESSLVGTFFIMMLSLF